MAGGFGYRALVCVTTCQRLGNLRRYLAHFAAFCASDPRFHLVVALDGDDDAYRDFCREWNLPLVYADRREGVGLSKNRVLERFGDYDYYFFVDDDVELVDGRVFPRHVELARRTGYHHFSLFERGGLRKPTGETRVDNTVVRHGMFGGGQFSFFTGGGLVRVGGWHPGFAEYRRWGHTEHSYRFYHAGLTPAPFNVVEELAECCVWHYPQAVEQVAEVATDVDQIPAAERALIDALTIHVPLQALAAHHHNGVAPGSTSRLAQILDGHGRYPLIQGAELRRCRSDYQLWRARTAPTLASRLVAFVRALQSPGNPWIRYMVRRGMRDVFAPRG